MHYAVGRAKERQAGGMAECSFPKQRDQYFPLYQYVSRKNLEKRMLFFGTKKLVQRVNQCSCGWTLGHVVHAGADLEGEDARDVGDCGDSLLRRLCLDAVAVGDHAPFGEVRTYDTLFLLRSGSEHVKLL